MARRTKELTIAPDNPANRDHGKHFLLTEMPAVQGEKWARRALLALVKGGGAEINEEIAAMGFAGFAYVGINALGRLDDADLEPLLDEMMQCITYYPGGDKRITRKFVPGKDDCDIEEISTLLLLRKEILELHVNFSLGSVLSGFRQRMTATTTDVDTPNTSTSPSPSDLSSRAA
jgi:hypothetical protein